MAVHIFLNRSYIELHNTADRMKMKVCEGINDTVFILLCEDMPDFLNSHPV